MQSIRSRQLTSQLAYDGSAFTASKPWNFPAETQIDGIDIIEGLVQAGATTVALGLVVTGNTASITTNTNRMNTIIDSGSTLDTISELKAAWEGGDSTLQTAIGALTTTASTDRALIRAEAEAEYALIATAYGTADTGLLNTFTAADTAAATFNASARGDVLSYVIASDTAIQTQITATNAAIALRAPIDEPTFTGDVTINSNKIVGDSGTEIRFNQTNLQLNTHSSGSLTGSAFGQIAVGIHPKTDQTYDCGSSGKRWREVYTNDLDFNGTFYKDGVAFAKGDIALGNVNNTADANKPISTAAAAKNTSQDAAILANISAFAAADVVVTNAYTSADNAIRGRLDTAEAKSSYTDPTTQTLLSAEATSRASADNTLSGRIDTAEAKSSYTDPTTQTLLSAEATSRAAADTTLSGRLDIAEAKSSFTDPTTQTLLSAEAASRASADNTLSGRLDTAEAKTSFTDPTTQTLLTAEATTRASQTAENAADIVTNTTAIALNTAKISFSTADSTLVTQNKDNITDLQTDIAGLDAVVNTTHANLHTSHTSSIATKVNSADGTHTGDTTFDGNTLAIDSSNSRVGIGKTDPSFMLHMHDAGGAAEFRISRDLSDNHVTINSASFTKYGNGTGNTPYKWRIVTADPFVWETSNTEWMRLDPNGNLGLGTTSPGFKLDVNGTARISGTVHMPNLPTSDPLVAGQLWVNNANKIVVSIG